MRLLPRAKPLGRLLANHSALALLAILIVGAALRVPFLTNDISEFPTDRNWVVAEYMRYQMHCLDKAHFLRSIAVFFPFVPYLPEFQFIPDAGVILSWFGIPYILGARLFNLAFNLLGGWGLYLLGREWKNRAAGLMTALAYMIMPLSILVGRSILAENITNTFLIWALVFAFGLPRLSWKTNAAGLIIACALIIPAKLIFLIFWPIPVSLYLWRNRANAKRAICVALIATLATYLIACLHYRLGIFNPFPRLLQIRASYKHLTATGDDLYSARAWQLTMSRVILALTLPGLFFSAFGLVEIAAKFRAHLWLWAWTAISLVYIWFNCRANTYWAYAISAPASLLIGAALARHALKSWSAMLCATLLCVLGCQFCPGYAKVRGYLCPDPRYQAAASFKNLMAGGPALFRFPIYGVDLSHYMGVEGTHYEKLPPQTSVRQTLAGNYARYLTVANGLDSLDLTLFERRPVLAHEPGLATLFDTRPNAQIGAPVPGNAQPSPGLPLSIGPNLRVIQACVPSNLPLNPGRKFTLELTWERTSPALNNAVLLSLEHLNSRLLMPVYVHSRGVQMNNAPQPALQLPSFASGAREKAAYDLELPQGLPAGNYQLVLNLLPARSPYASSALPPGVALPLPLAVAPPAPAAAGRARYVFPAAQLAWLYPKRVYGVNFWSPFASQTFLEGSGAAILGAGLPAGDYGVELEGAPAGCGDDEKTRWPRLAVSLASNPGARTIIDYRGMPFENHSARINWKGPEDALIIRLVNPASAGGNAAYPLYFGDLPGRQRSWAPARIVFTPKH